MLPAHASISKTSFWSETPISDREAEDGTPYSQRRQVCILLRLILCKIQNHRDLFKSYGTVRPPPRAFLMQEKIMQFLLPVEEAQESRWHFDCSHHVDREDIDHTRNMKLKRPSASVQDRSESLSRLPLNRPLLGTAFLHNRRLGVCPLMLNPSAGNHSTPAHGTHGARNLQASSMSLRAV
jgi:hypothetical protein